MYSNPLIKKHANGGSTTSQEEQVMAEFFEWLTTSVQDFQGMDIEQVAQTIQGMTKTPEGKKQVEVLLKQFAASKQSQTGMFKQGGKLHDFICKHATGGRVKAGCGCHENGGEIESAEKGTKTKNNYALDGLNFVERYYDSSGNAVYTLAQSRETLPSNMRSNPYSEYSQNGGEYQGDGQVSIVDFGNGRTAINMDPYGVTPGDTFAHGADSIAVLNRLRQIAPKADIILGPAIREDGGVISTKNNRWFPNFFRRNRSDSPIGSLNIQNDNEYRPITDLRTRVNVITPKRVPKFILPSKIYTPAWESLSNDANIEARNKIDEDLENRYGYKCGGKVKKGEDGMVSEKKTPDTGEIKQGKPRSKVSQIIDDNSKARNFVNGVSRFVDSPVVRWPVAGALAYGGWKLGGLLNKLNNKLGVELEMKFAPKLLGATASQIKPKYLYNAFTFNNEKNRGVSSKEALYAIPSDFPDDL